MFRLTSAFFFNFDFFLLTGEVFSVTKGETSSTVDDVELLEFVLKLLLLTEIVKRSTFGDKFILCKADSDIEKLLILKRNT